MQNPLHYRRKLHSPPRANALGLSWQQRAFIYVLVANWIFSLALFLVGKALWRWVPAQWSTSGDKLALVFKCAAFAILPAVVAICVVAAQRLDPNMMVGRVAKPNTALDINTRFVLNTFEQFTAFLVAIAVVALYSDPAQARALPLLTS